jgi:membrane associated rhomboid family serine protease
VGRTPVTLLLAAACALVYVLFQHGGLALGVPRGIEYRCNAAEYGLIPYELTHPGGQLTDPYCQPQAEEEAHPGEAEHDHPRTDPGLTADAPAAVTVLSSMFMHGGLLHLGGLLLLLAAAGPRLEARLGSARFLLVFLAAGAGTAGALAVVAPDLPIPTIGSSGAVAGVVGGLVALLPRARVTPFELPALSLLAAAVLLQIAFARGDVAQPVAGAGGDIVYAAPLAGLAIGLALARLLAAPRLGGATLYAPRSGRSG